LVEKLGGVLQKTDNKVEEVLLKTYHIYKWFKLIQLIWIYL
jgi:hypothetical protein